MRPEIKGALFLTLSVFSFASMSTLVKVAGPEIPAIELVFFRGLFGLPILFLIAYRRKDPIIGKRRWLLLTRGITGTIAMFMLFYSLKSLPVADATLLNQSAPIFVLPLAVLFLKERVTLLHAILVAAAFIGAIMVIGPSFRAFNFPGAVALGSALFAAISYVLVRKLIRTEHTSTVVLWFTFIATVIAVPPMIPVFVLPGPKMLAVVAAMAVFATMGQLLMTKAYSFGEAGRLAVIGSFGAIFGACFDFAIWGHVPGLRVVAGGVMIIASCSLIQVIKGSVPHTRPE